LLTAAWRTAKIPAAAAAVTAGLLAAGLPIAAASPAAAGARQHAMAPHYRVRQILNGMKLRHTFVLAGSTKRRSGPLANPDDITVLGRHLYTAF
jgi:hypothetical protein